MARSAKHHRGDAAGGAPETGVDGASAIEVERRRLERRLEAALNEQGKRTRQLAVAQKSKGRKRVAKRRRQVDDAAKRVAALNDRLAVLAGSARLQPR
jgi:seryl-tRNA synthetase